MVQQLPDKEKQFDLPWKAKAGYATEPQAGARSKISCWPVGRSDHWVTESMMVIKGGGLPEIIFWGNVINEQNKLPHIVPWYH